MEEETQNGKQCSVISSLTNKHGSYILLLGSVLLLLLQANHIRVFPEIRFLSNE